MLIEFLVKDEWLVQKKPKDSRSQVIEHGKQQSYRGVISLTIFVQNNILDKMIFVSPLLMIGVFLLGMFIMTNQFNSDMEKQRIEEMKIMSQETKLFNSLDCEEKKDYLKNKDLTSGGLFNRNINEQFYRQYVVECKS